MINHYRTESPGLIAFDTLRAEDEPWLETCYVEPENLALLAGSRSVAIFAGRGIGKTALYQALFRRCYAEGKPLRLVVDWQLLPLSPVETSGATAVRMQASHIFDACALALSRYLLGHPNLLVVKSAPSWVHQTIAWFLQTQGHGDLIARLGPLVESAPGETMGFLSDLLTTPAPPILASHAGPEQIAARLVEALLRIHLDGVWVLVDGAEAWLEAEPEQMQATLSAFLATLPLFERSQFVYKLLLPLQLESLLIHSAALVRHRADGYRLEWTASLLQRMVERRLSMAVAKDFMLTDLCEDSSSLQKWLVRAGGRSPREWLDQVRPLVSHYLANHLNKPIDNMTWRRLRRQHSPRFYLNEASRLISVGGRIVSIEELPAKGYDLLCYLFQHNGRVIAKDELFFRAYRGLAEIPPPWDEKDYEPPKAYEGLLDTVIYRLRQAIEPDPSDPVLLRTVRGHGIRLESRW
jgi:DNA-binding winged helix-turn-helix (wHTH) protein